MVRASEKKSFQNILGTFPSHTTPCPRSQNAADSLMGGVMDNNYHFLQGLGAVVFINQDGHVPIQVEDDNVDLSECHCSEYYNI